MFPDVPLAEPRRIHELALVDDGLAELAFGLVHGVPGPELQGMVHAALVGKVPGGRIGYIARPNLAQLLPRPVDLRACAAKVHAPRTKSPLQDFRFRYRLRFPRFL